MSEGSLATTPPADPPVLPYGRERSPRLKRWLRRIGLLLWIGIVAAVAWDKWGVWIRLRADLAWQEYELTRHAEPPDRVVFESEPTERERLAALPDYRASEVGRPWSKAGASKARAGDAALYLAVGLEAKKYGQARSLLADYEELMEPPSNELPNFADAPDYAPERPPDDSAVAYAGHRTSPAGHQRLVFVDVEWHGTVPAVRLSGYTRDTGLLRAKVGYGYGSYTTSRMLTAPWLRVYAGQSNADPAKVTFRYATPDGEGQIAATLQDDDVIDFVVVDGPLKLPQSK